MDILPSTLLVSEPILQEKTGLLDILKTSTILPLSNTIEESENEKRNDLLVVSPYEDEDHLLDLDTLDIPNRIFAKALVRLKCLREDYATAPYVEIFNVSLAIILCCLKSKEYCCL